MSETTLHKSAAPTLQRASGMKSIIVGFLAVMALTGCGVGMDELEGEQVGSSRSSAGLMSAMMDNSTSAQAELRPPGSVDPRVALPQDPIPVFEGKSLPPVAPRPTK